MKTIKISLFWCFALVIVSCQTPEKSELYKTPSHFFSMYKKAEIMMLGTFHFNDAGLDGYKLESIDLFSDKRQLEILELVNLLAAFNPTVIAIEWLPENQKWVDSTYSEYLNGRFELRKNEVYQLGYRLAEKTGAKIVCIDAKQRMYDDWVSEDQIIEIAEKNNQQHYLKKFEKRQLEYASYHNYKEELKHNKLSLKEYFKYLNSDSALYTNHGWYMQQYLAIGDTDEFPLIDEWTRWYNRNYRIFGNLLRLIETGEERILLIIGQGHIPILKQATQASPDTKYIEVIPFLDK